MHRVLPASFALLIALSACNAERPATDPAAPAPATSPAKAPATSAADIGPARWNGYGDLRFGMTAAEAKQAWQGELKGAPGEGDICYYLTPASVKNPGEFALMVESDKFARYDVGNKAEVAPGGGKVGMSAVDIGKRYGDRIEEQVHKYVQGGKYLRIKAAGGGDGVLLFETDAAGTVTSWRVGHVPQVDYVEGCS